MQERSEPLPENAENHIRIKPAFYNPRYYYLNKLLFWVEWAIKNYLAPLTKDKKIKLLDFGCGTKPYTPLFKKYPIDYIGADLSWNPHADIYIENQRVQSPDNEYDALISTQVLEHVEDYNLYLQEAYRILKNDGMLVLSTHGYWMYHPDPTDFWRWTSAGLKKIITEQGFEIIAFKGILGRASMGMQLVQDGILFKIPQWSRPILACIMQPLVWLFDKISSQKARDNDACTYLVIAKKIRKDI